MSVVRSILTLLGAFCCSARFERQCAEYIRRWNYSVDTNETAIYKP